MVRSPDRPHRRRRIRLWTALALLAALGLAVAGRDRLESGSSPGTDGPAAQAQSPLERARRHLADDTPRAAVIELRNLLAGEPEHPQARRLLGRAYVASGEAAAGLAELARARALGADMPDPAPAELDALLLLGRHQEVIGRVALAEGADRSARMRLARASARLGLGQLERAREDFTEVLVLDPDSTSARMGLARIAIAERRLDEADRLLRDARAAAPGNPELWLLTGELRLMGADLEGAGEALAHARRAPATELRARLVLARLALARGRPAEALEHAASVLDRRPRAAEGHYLRALAANALGRRETARAALRSVLSLEPEHPGATLLLARIAARRGDSHEAARALNTLRERFPGERELELRLAATQLAQGAARAALETLAPLAAVDRDDPAVALLEGRALAALGREAEALERLRHAARAEPAASPPLVGLHLERGEPERALAVAERFVERSPGAARAHRLLGEVLVRMGQRARAREALARATELDPADPAALRALASLDLAAGHRAAARRRLEGALGNAPGHVPSLVLLARIEALDDRSRAIALLERARAASPDAAEARERLARLYLEDARYAEAIGAAEEALAADSGRTGAKVLLGRAQAAAGWLDAARSTLDAAVRDAPEDVDASAALAEVAQRQGDLTRARALLSEVVTRDPNRLPARTALVKVEMMSGRLESARVHARRLEADQPRSPEPPALLGDIAFAGARLEAASRHYRESLARGGTETVLLKLHRVELRRGRSGAALALLEEWLERHPRAGRIRLTLAQTHARLGEHKRAIRAYRRMLEDYPDSTLALHALAWLLATHHPETALEHAARAYALEPDEPAVLHVYGWLLARNGDDAAGRRYLERAAERDPTNPALREHLDRVGGAPPPEHPEAAGPATR